MERACKQCGEIFDADAAWKQICLPCWRSNKAKEQGGSYGGHKQHSGHQKFDQSFYDRVFGKQQQIPDDMLKTLIMLCHPDRHGGKESATRATQFLLSLRGK